ncbi:MAG: DUF4065 domain-containing protein [Alphaproteobacteria bacterium]|nr:MAG: DUF4065 domain-containing protein [Alphaproteobacteria bacterium]
MVKQRPLPAKLEAVLIRLAKSRKLNLTQAAKLPYLVDVVAQHVLGRSITGGTHQAWKYGVVTAEAWRCLNREDQSSALRVEPVRWSEEKRVRILEDVEVAELTPEEEEIVDAVAGVFGDVWATELGAMTKRMNPQIRTWGTNETADVGPDAYERMSRDYQEMAEAAARCTLDGLRRSSEPVADVEEALA